MGGRKGALFSILPTVFFCCITFSMGALDYGCQITSSWYKILDFLFKQLFPGWVILKKEIPNTHTHTDTKQKDEKRNN